MPRRVTVAPAALRDLDQARRWLLQPGSGERARATIRALRHAVSQLLREEPCRHAVSKDHPGMREVPVEGGSRVIYVVTPDTGNDATAGNVEVLRVFGPARSEHGLSSN